MSASFSAVGEWVIKLTASVVKRSKRSAELVATAGCSFASVFLHRLLPAQLVTDINCFKKTLLDRMVAETVQEQANAKKKLAEATDAHNRATLAKKKAQADIGRIEAETYAIRVDADTRRQQAIADATTRFIEAVSKLRQDGGDLFMSADNLQAFVQDCEARLPRLKPVHGDPPAGGFIES